jgi:cysteine desulfurase
MSLIYLDNSTTTKPSEKAVGRMMPFFTDLWGIPSTPHQKGQEVFPALRESYQTLYRVLGASEEDTIIFTSSGTEGINQVIQSVYQHVTLKTGKNQFLAAQTDEAAAILATSHLEHMSCVAKLIEVNHQGIVTVDKLIEKISPRTALVSLSWANGLTGVVQPLQDIIQLCKQRGILLHLDASHVIGKLFYDLQEIQADFVTFNGEQLHAPKGTGGLYIRKGVKCSPLLIGSSDQAGLRGGSLNVSGLVGLATAAQEAIESRDYLCTEIARLRDHLETELQRQLPQIKPLFQDQERLPHCTTIAFPGISNEALLFALNRKGICASIGGGNFQQLALILTASHVPIQLAYSALSFSLSRYTTEAEIERALPLIIDSVKNLNKIAGHLLV